MNTGLVPSRASLNSHGGAPLFLIGYLNSDGLMIKLLPAIDLPLKENFTLIIFSLFCLNWPRIEFYNPIYKNKL